MHSTHYSLLERLRTSNLENGEAWKRFVEIYTPLLLHWSTRLAVPHDDRVDLVQDTLAKLLLGIKKYKRENQKSFRSWLFVVLKNTWLDGQRRKESVIIGGFEGTGEPAIGDPNEEWTKKDYHDYLLRRIQQLVMSDFPLTSQKAFQLHVLHEKSPQEVAEELGLTPNAVYLIRSRILKRIREELAGLLD